jgi:glycosyltransferase involved in cell wall biosynthesis
MLHTIGSLLKKWLGSTKPYRLAAEIRKGVRAIGAMDHRQVTLTPAGVPSGSVLLSYILDAFYLQPEDPTFVKHTHFWETRQIAQTWLDLGYAVDAIHWKNHEFVPQKRYDFFIDVRMNLERIAPFLNRDCVKIMHIETAHWLFHMAAQHERLLAVQRRRQATIGTHKVVSPNWAIEFADCATVLGNGFTCNTYAYAQKPLYPLRISAPTVYPWPAEKDFDTCRRNFLWFGSGGMVHKGLDLVLEAFAQMPDFHLTVCGPIKDEKDFERVYDAELHRTANIRTVGWVDVSSEVFQEILTSCVGIVYPSCSEGQCGSVVTCLHGGLIPVVSYESGLDVGGDMGFILRDSSLQEIQRAVRKVAEMCVEELNARARQVWEYARANHTRDAFAKAYRNTAEQILDFSKNRTVQVERNVRE